MPRATVVPPGGGEVIGDTPERRIVLVCEEDALHATSVRMAARGEGADLHVHRRHSDLFYILDGELTVRLGPAGEPVVLTAGTLARIPPLVVHGYRNTSDAEARFVNLHAPGTGFAPYLRALRDGRPHSFDQELPGADARPATDASIGRGETVGGRGGERVTMLADEPAVAVAEVALDGDAPPPDARADDHLTAVYVLDGIVDVEVGDERVRAEAGSWITVPPGIPHAAGARAAARYLRIRAGG